MKDIFDQLTEHVAKKHPNLPKDGANALVEIACYQIEVAQAIEESSLDERTKHGAGLVMSGWMLVVTDRSVLTLYITYKTNLRLFEVIGPRAARLGLYDHWKMMQLVKKFESYVESTQEEIQNFFHRN